MKTYIANRVVQAADYVLQTNCTVRQAGKHFAVSKSTVHKDITERLEKINPSLFGAVREVLDKNKSERHIRGGQATKLHYINLKNNLSFEKSK